MRNQCPNCNARTGLADFGDGAYCFACKEKSFSKSLLVRKESKNKNTAEEVYKDCVAVYESNDALDYLRQFYFTDLDFMDISTFQWNPRLQRIIFPVNGAACWGRSIDPNTVPKAMFYGKSDQDCYLRKIKLDTDTLVLVEDIISCIRVSEYENSMALSGTRVKNNLQLTNILKYKNIILWLDGDLAGIKGAEKIKRDFKLYKNIRVITTKKDPKEFSFNELQDILND